MIKKVCQGDTYCTSVTVDASQGAFTSYPPNVDNLSFYKVRPKEEIRRQSTDGRRYERSKGKATKDKSAGKTENHRPLESNQKCNWGMFPKNEAKKQYGMKDRRTS